MAEGPAGNTTLGHGMWRRASGGDNGSWDLLACFGEAARKPSLRECPLRELPGQRRGDGAAGVDSAGHHCRSGDACRSYKAPLTDPAAGPLLGRRSNVWPVLVLRNPGPQPLWSPFTVATSGRLRRGSQCLTPAGTRCRTVNPGAGHRCGSRTPGGGFGKRRLPDWGSRRDGRATIEDIQQPTRR